jgi:NADPH:quinone reductase-like Zn-dependent oxidoreductase
MAESGALALMPAGLTYAEAASVPNGALTALPFLRDQGRVRRGQMVVVYGASGSVGTAAVQLARAYGAEVTGVCGPANLELVRSLGAGRVVDYTREGLTRLGHRYDIIFDAVGKLSLARCWDRLARNGVYLTVIPRPGVLLRAARQKAEDLCFVRELIECGQFRPVIDRHYPLEQIAQAHHYVQGGHKKGNVVITID